MSELSKREQFAATALHGIITGHTLLCGWGPVPTNELCVEAVKFADELLLLLEQSPEGDSDEVVERTETLGGN
jgi:hypothetical protein